MGSSGWRLHSGEFDPLGSRRGRERRSHMGCTLLSTGQVSLATDQCFERTEVGRPRRSQGERRDVLGEMELTRLEGG